MEIKDKRFIEDTFPIREVSIEGAKEKSIRHGHLSTLHIWWARRPLATSRATNLAALIPALDNEEEKQKIRNFIAEISKWDNSDNETLLSKARTMILDANSGVPPKVLDPFGGGGSIPLEALRLGCETYSNDYNPVAVLLQKCTLEYPQRFGGLMPLNQYLETRSWIEEEFCEKDDLSTENLLLNEEEIDYNVELINPLSKDLKYYGESLINELSREIGKFYPSDIDGGIPVGYIWARTIKCQNPTCGIDIPLMRQYGLSTKDSKQVVLYPYVQSKSIKFKIIAGDYKLVDAGFDPDKGTVSRSVVVCPSCGSIIDDKITRRLFQQGQCSQRLIAVVTHYFKKTEINTNLNEIVRDLKENQVHRLIIEALANEGFKLEIKYFEISKKSDKSYQLNYNSPERNIEFKITYLKNKLTIEPQGKAYRLASANDMSAYIEAEKYLEKKREELMNLWGIDPVPDDKIPLMSGVFNVPIYGMDHWGKLFNSRQKLSLVVLMDALRKRIEHDKINDFDKAIFTYLGICIDRLADYNSTLTTWVSNGEFVGHTFTKQALPMIWDYCEINPNSQATGDWNSSINWVRRVIENNSFAVSNPSVITNQSATDLKYPENYFDAVFTDPPYYNSVPYADLSDFFYSFLKRSIGELYPELFSTPMTPKSLEITEMIGWDPIRYPNKDKFFFENNLKKAFQEIYRILKVGGIATIVYAHKSTEGWETVINALLDSNLIVTGSYPLNTEMQMRMRAKDSATLSSSIYIIVRKLPKEGTGFYNEVREELKNYLNNKLNQLWGEGIVGADFFIAAIGSAIEVFGKYENVIDYEGNLKRANSLLDDVREIVMNYTVAHILHNGFSGEVSELTKFYVLYRFSYGEGKLSFDEANKLARSVGIDLSQEFNRDGFIKKEKEIVRVLTANNRKIEDLKDKTELIDVLHHSVLLWESGKKDKMMELLADTGFGKSEAFFRVAQAISESLAKTSPESREKKLLDGFLGSKERIKSDITNTKVTKKNIQGKLEF